MGSKVRLMFLVLVVAVGVAGCSSDKEKAKSAPPAPAAQAQKPLEPEPPPPEVLAVKGKVLEVIDTGSFVYVSLDWKGKPVWAVVPGVELKVGEVISLDHATMMEKGFRSTVLNRTFDKLVFASGVEGKSPRKQSDKSAKAHDLTSRRSAKVMVPPSPAPPQPTKKAAVKVAEKAAK